MSKHAIEFRLSGTGLPDGEIGMGELAGVAGALQELATRIGRFSIDQVGRGRTKSSVEDVTRLRLTGLSDGSTRLHVAYGQPDVLAIDVSLEDATETSFVEIIEALSSGDRPGWVPEPVAESALKVLDALERSAASIEVTTPLDKKFEIRPAIAERAVWRPAPPASHEEASAVGRLEKVDLKDHQFRIRDDVGNAIALRHVVDAERVASLINQRVTATGQAARGERGELRGLDDPVLEAAPLPREWGAGIGVDWSSELAKPGPDAQGGVELTDEEFADYLAELKS